MLDRFITPGPLPSANQAELLIILAEECNEAAKRVSKALRFGLNEVQPGQDATNAERIGQELQDVAALVSVCVEAGILSVDLEESEARRKKLQKLYRFCQREENRALVERLLSCSKDEEEYETADAHVVLTWPLSCYDTESCARHGRCMYFGCYHEGRDIEDEILVEEEKRDKATAFNYRPKGWLKKQTEKAKAETAAWRSVAHKAAAPSKREDG